jgi:hypothetical protein
VLAGAALVASVTPAGALAGRDMTGSALRAAVLAGAALVARSRLRARSPLAT